MAQILLLMEFPAMIMDSNEVVVDGVLIFFKHFFLPLSFFFSVLFFILQAVFS